MEYLNFIPLLLVGYFFMKALMGGMRRDFSDGYFKENKAKTGKKYANWFGVPYQKERS
ncbi:MAG: hypothetical protein HQL50_06005 [Magnetococcales bacterium]|nr:hypothetical protein [Magnetococcales bacterium]